MFEAFIESQPAKSSADEWVETEIQGKVTAQNRFWPGGHKSNAESLPHYSNSKWEGDN